MKKQYIDHVDIVTSHKCNNNCKHCIDKFVHQSDNFIGYATVERFLKLIRKHTKKKGLEVLLLGGEPTMMPFADLVEIAALAHKMNFNIIMSTNGILKDKIIALLPYFDSIQVTVNNDAQIDYWRQWPDKINIKLAGDGSLTMSKLQHFIEYTEGFSRRSVSMYFTPEFEELCTDPQIWELLNTLEWQRNGSYEYAFYKGVRFKKCIFGETNIVDEPTVPKVYPNGKYNKTWCNEDLDDYLKGNWNREKITVSDILLGWWVFIFAAAFYVCLFIAGIIAAPFMWIREMILGIKERRRIKKKYKRIKEEKIYEA